MPLHREGISYIKEYLRVRREVPLNKLWVCDRRHPLSRTWLCILFKDLKRYTGITKDVKLHALRYKRATSLLKDGVNLYSIKEYLGHSDIQTTVNYLHSDLQHLTDVAQKGGLLGS